MNNSVHNLSEVLDYLLHKNRIRATELARRLKINQSTIQRLLSGETKHAKADTLQAIATFFSVSLEQLQGHEPLPERRVNFHQCKYVPLLAWEESTTLTTESSDLNDRPIIMTDSQVSDQTFALRMKDSSMAPMIPQDALLIVDPNKKPIDRSFIIVQLGQKAEVVCRQLFVDGIDYFLKPLSSEFQDFSMKLLSPTDRILGVVMQVRWDYQ